MNNMGSILQALSPKHHRPKTTSACDGKRPNEYFNMEKRLGIRAPKRKMGSQLLDNPDQLLRMLRDVTPERKRPTKQHFEQSFDETWGSPKILNMLGDLTPKCRKPGHNKTIQLSPLIGKNYKPPSPKGKKKKKKKKGKKGKGK